MQLGEYQSWNNFGITLTKTLLYSRKSLRQAKHSLHVLNICYLQQHYVYKLQTAIDQSYCFSLEDQHFAKAA